MKKTICIMCMMVLLFFLGACSYSKEAMKGNNVYQESITIGILPDVDSIPFIIAQEKGYFQEEGLRVTLEQFKSAVDRDSALQSGSLDGAVSDILAAAFAKDNGFPMVITSMTNGSYKLLVNQNENIDDIQGLSGRDVAISKNTVIEYVTDKIMMEGGLTPDDIHKVIVPKIPIRLEMLQKGKVVAATLPEPLATVAIKEGAKLLNSSDHLDINPGVFIFTAKAVEEKSGAIQAMYRAYNKAVEFLAKESPENYMDMLIEKGGFPETVKGAITLPQYTKAAVPSEEEVHDVIAWLYKRQLIKNSYDYEELVNDQFVR
ncbi:ABC transporter substrate-binding protein [Thermotalea metallivorans]|uniref:Putative aliphatic sulfonates-binding protein n=1 Tax=Thermotalea metallivorans TaxID=520762 RepID=A0A140LBE7_9FIRM|nr:MetQ/NlpA family ABC transporter substrate-binding protein [Thermotalea metallivorans]KXG77872.1 putative aliphatic sulfonates-binding protein [Thermotalea metallivorans]